MMSTSFDYLIVGGGIAGVTCAETIYELHPEATIGLVSASSTVKSAINLRRVTRLIEDFDISEASGSVLEKKCPNVKVLYGVMTSLDHNSKVIALHNGDIIGYQKICLCIGGYPKLISNECPLVLGIRDTESVAEFQNHLKNARRIVLVGNGGIATELAYEIEGCSVIWVVKDKNISATFVDAGASEFLMPRLLEEKESKTEPVKRHQFTVDEDKTVIKRILPDEYSADSQLKGGALGPDWAAGLSMKGASGDDNFVHVVYKSQVMEFWIKDDVPEDKRLAANQHKNSTPKIHDWPLFVELTNGDVYGCDLLVSATGVIPSGVKYFGKDFNNAITLSGDGGIPINEQMRTELPHVYAAGDCATANWELSPHWFQMRLWCQARQMGFQAAKAMVADLKNEPEVPGDFSFELFTHVTRFFNFKIVLLGKFNAQDLGNDYELLLRMTRGEEYIKCVMQNGRMQGCLLIGETDLEETFENLILNQIDLSPFGIELLNPNIDIEDYFD